LKFNNAFTKMLTGKNITRENATSSFGLDKGVIVRTKKNGAISTARFGSSDMLANDWKVIKTK